MYNWKKRTGIVLLAIPLLLVSAEAAETEWNSKAVETEYNDVKNGSDAARKMPDEAETDSGEAWDFSIEDELVADFVPAMEEGRIEAWLQPIVDPVSGELCGAEALARWKRGEEMVSPSVFIPVLEETGLVRELDEHIFRQVCMFLAEQMKQNSDHNAFFPVSVNVSGVSAYREGIAADYKDIMTEAGLPEGSVRVELTESIDLDHDRLTEVVQEFHDAGFLIEMDDFGAGYASLANLASVPYDVLKLDKSLTDGIGTERGELLLEAVVDLAEKLDMFVIAEGVETAEQAEFLKNTGCRGLQGYYYSKPLPMSEFAEAFQKTFRN